MRWYQPEEGTRLPRPNWETFLSSWLHLCDFYSLLSFYQVFVELFCCCCDSWCGSRGQCSLLFQLLLDRCPRKRKWWQTNLSRIYWTILCQLLTSVNRESNQLLSWCFKFKFQRDKALEYLNVIYRWSKNTQKNWAPFFRIFSFVIIMLVDWQVATLLVKYLWI